MKHLRNTFFILLGAVILWWCAQLAFGDWLQSNAIIMFFFGLLFLWLPGVIALLFARKEGTTLPIFKGRVKTYFGILAWSLGICLVGFILSIPFGYFKSSGYLFSEYSVIKQVGMFAVLLFASFCLISFIFSFLFLGGEIYWRGYMWQKLKGRGIWWVFLVIAFAWSLWSIPFAYASPNQSLLYVPFTLFFCFLLTPYLLYWRHKTGSIYAASLAYGSLMGGFVFFLTVFPPTAVEAFAPFGIGCAVALFAACLILKVYRKETWITHEES